MRKKAWERAKENRKLVGEVARLVGVRPQTARRWFLAPDHPDHRRIRDNDVLRQLAQRHDLQPNDFFWLPGDKSRRRKARAAELAEVRP